MASLEWGSETSPPDDVTLAGAAGLDGVGEDGNRGSEVVPDFVCLHEVSDNRSKPSNPALNKTDWDFMVWLQGYSGGIGIGVRLMLRKPNFNLR